MQATVDSYGSILLGVHSGHHLLTLHRTENHPFHRHELLPDQALAAAGAEEALRGRVPAEVIVRHSLHFRVDGIVAPLTHHSMVLHIARLAHRLVTDHHVYFSGQDVVAVKAAEVLQMPILVFCLGILIAEYQLITASTAGLLAVTVMSATVQLPILPEVNHVDQEFTTGAADKTCRVPEFVVASSFSIDGWVSFPHGVFAAVTGILGLLGFCRLVLGTHCCWGVSVSGRVVHLVTLSIHLGRKLHVAHAQSFTLIFLHELFHLLHLFGRQLVALRRVLVMCRELLRQLLLPVLRPL